MDGSLKYLLLVMMGVMCVLPMHAKTTSDFIEAFRAGDYELVCREGLETYYGGRNDEMFVIMVGTACARIDNINPLGMLQRNLVSTASARETASYFATLVLQKRLLYQFMIDHTAITSLHLPYSNHILSIVFERIANGSYTWVSDAPKMIKVFDGDKSMIISVSDDEPKKILIDEYQGDTLVKRRWFQ